MTNLSLVDTLPDIPVFRDGASSRAVSDFKYTRDFHSLDQLSEFIDHLENLGFERFHIEQYNRSSWELVWENQPFVTS